MTAIAMIHVLKVIAGGPGIFCLSTPVWYFPYRRLVERLRLFKDKRGRVREANLIDWLNASGIGFFLGAFLLPLGITPNHGPIDRSPVEQRNSSHLHKDLLPVHPPADQPQ